MSRARRMKLRRSSRERTGRTRSPGALTLELLQVFENRAPLLGGELGAEVVPAVEIPRQRGVEEELARGGAASSPSSVGAGVLRVEESQAIEIVVGARADIEPGGTLA